MNRHHASRATAAQHGSDDPGHRRGRAFHQARRHSRRVRLLRYALPVMAIGGLLVIALVIALDPLRFYRDLPIDFARITLDGTKLTIEAPKLTGFTRDRRPYSITAGAAAQDLTRTNIVELSEIRAEVGLANRGETSMRAFNGVYDIKAENLKLSGGIEIISSGGYHVWLSDAFLEIRKGHILTEQPVNAVFPDGNIHAGRLEIFDHGERTVFSGGVTVNLQLPPPGSEGAATRPAETADARR